MRLGKFESAGKESIGEGWQKRVFVDPKNEKRIIAEMREGYMKDTIRQLKGRYYLTKIAHLLLPENIPAVYQAGESVEGKQTLDAERIAHSPKHALLQKTWRTGKGFGAAYKQAQKELGAEIQELAPRLKHIGLGLGVDTYTANFTKDKKGNAYYLETFKPWEINLPDSGEVEMWFDEKKLRNAIDELSDSATKEKCKRLLERVFALAKEEERELRTINTR